MQRLAGILSLGPPWCPGQGALGLIRHLSRCLHQLALQSRVWGPPAPCCPLLITRPFSWVCCILSKLFTTTSQPPQPSSARSSLLQTSLSLVFNIVLAALVASLCWCPPPAGSSLPISVAPGEGLRGAAVLGARRGL